MIVFFKLSGANLVYATHEFLDGDQFRRSLYNCTPTDLCSTLISESVADLPNVGDYRDILGDTVRLINTAKELPDLNKETQYMTYDESGDTLSVKNIGELELTTDATDSHQPYDGIPDIPGDGTSSCNIFIKKKDSEGAYLTGAEDNDTVEISCSRGKLSAIQVELVNGEAQVSLTSVAETCVSQIRATADVLSEGNIEIQFAPVS